MELEKLVLDDDLFVLFEKFRYGVSLDELHVNVFYNLMNRLKLPYKTNASQIQRCRNELPKPYLDSIAPAILAVGDDTKLEDLALNTQYRVVLTGKTTQCNLPFVNIASQVFMNDFNIRVKRNVSRDSIQSYIKRCSHGAREIDVVDKYLKDAIVRGNCQLEKLIDIDDETITINCYESYLDSQCTTSGALRTYLADYCSNYVKTKRENFDHIHDRYIRFVYPDYKMEIMLSSGIEYLFDTSKELCCVFRIT